MRKILFILATALTLSASAQTEGDSTEGRHEVALGVGLGSLTNRNYDHLTSAINHQLGLVSDDENVLARGANLRYYYRLDGHWAIGASVGFAYNAKEYGAEQRQPTATQSGLETVKTSATQLYVIPSARYRWYHTRATSLYSRLGAGLMHERLHAESLFYPDFASQHSTNKLAFAWQATFVGVELGASPLHFFAELGIGTEGFLQLGLCRRF